MGVLSTAKGWLKKAGAYLGTDTPRVYTDGQAVFLQLIKALNGGYNEWTSDRAKLAGKFTGWNYCAIHALATEIAGLQPKVARVVDEPAREDEVLKGLAGLRACRGETERRYLGAHLRRKKALRTRLTRKALAHIQEGDELEPVAAGHPLLKLLRNPNGPDTAWSFFYRLALNMRLFGVAYIYVIPNRVGDPAELWVLPSQWVREKRGKEKLVESYEIRPVAAYSDDSGFVGGWFPGYGGQGAIHPDNVIKIAYPHPKSVTDGYAPLQAIGSWVDVSEGIDKSRVYAFYNAALPGVVIELDKEIENPTKETLERIQASFTEKYSSVVNSRKPIVLAPGLKLIPAPTAVEMEYSASAEQARDNILAAHRTGKSQLGQVEHTSLANMVTARASYFQSAVKPEVTFIGQVLTEKLAKPRFDPRLVLYWEDPVPADPEFELKKMESMWDRGVITTNEWRAEEGKDPYDHGGDDPLLPMGVQEIPWATGEQDPLFAGAGVQPGGGAPPSGGADLDALLGGDSSADETPKGIPTPLAGDGASEEPAGPIPSPLAKRLNGRAALNGNGTH